MESVAGGPSLGTGAPESKKRVFPAPNGTRLSPNYELLNATKRLEQAGFGSGQAAVGGQHQVEAGAELARGPGDDSATLIADPTGDVGDDACGDPGPSPHDHQVVVRVRGRVAG